MSAVMQKPADFMSVDILVEAEGWLERAELETLARSALAAVSDEIEPAGTGELCLLFTSDAHIQTLNAEFRKKDKPTNVLSFPALASQENYLGDIALAQETVFREAQEKGIGVKDHIAHLIVHGFLHLQGYDHQTESDAEEMEDIERQALARLEIADPYLEVR